MGTSRSKRGRAPCEPLGFSSTKEDHMDMTTLLIILVVLFLLGGGGWGYSRYRR
jgi:hypothetical protein